MTLSDLYKQIESIGNQFNTWEIPMNKEVKLILNNDNTVKVEVYEQRRESKRTYRMSMPYKN